MANSYGLNNETGYSSVHILQSVLQQLYKNGYIYTTCANVYVELSEPSQIVIFFPKCHRIPAAGSSSHGPTSQNQLTASSSYKGTINQFPFSK